jgi:hypothetical protein
MKDNVMVRGLLYVFDKLVELDFLSPIDAALMLFYNLSVALRFHH